MFLVPLSSPPRSACPPNFARSIPVPVLERRLFETLYPRVNADDDLNRTTLRVDVN